MTWKYSKNKDEKGLKSIDIIDHNGRKIKTVNNPGHPDNSGSGGLQIEKEVKKVMKEEVEKKGPEPINSGSATSNKGVSPYGWKVMADMSAKDIKEKK